MGQFANGLRGTARFAFLALTLMALAPNVVGAQTTETDAPETVETPASPDPQSAPTAPFPGPDLEPFVDGVIAAAREDHQIPGVTVSVVSADKVIFAKGYGLADVETALPVDANKSLFRIASITKTFTATAIMQLVEQGKIDLDANIRTYLGDLAFDDSKGAITVANLLSHTPGFEDNIFGYYGANPALEGKSTREQLAGLAPAQIRAPGAVTGYSNYGYSLLGEIIATVSGMSYADYIETNILKPVGMPQSSIRVKFVAPGAGNAETERLRADEARSHTWSKGWFEPLTYPASMPSVAPEGGLSSSAGDMARYMRMHLNDGMIDGTQILRPETVTRMRSILFTNAPEVDANAHGFWKGSINGFATYEHGGSINAYRSHLLLVPELKLGIFISTNSESGGWATTLPHRIVSHFTSDTQPIALAPKPPADFAAWDARYAGTYLATRRNETTLGKLTVVAFGILRVTADPDGYIVFNAGNSERFVPVARDVFASVRDGRRIRFEGPAGGQATRIFASGGAVAFDRVGFLSTPMAIQGPLAAIVVLALLVLTAAWLRWHMGTPGARSGGQRVAQWVLMLTALTWLCFAGVFFQGMTAYASNPDLVYEAFPIPMIQYAWWAALAGTALTGLAVLLLLPVWLGRGWAFNWKLRYTGVVLVFAGFVWVLYHWNILTALAL